MRNHEGYFDPTAGLAIRSAQKREKGIHTAETLTYKLGELAAFQKVRRAILK